MSLSSRSTRGRRASRASWGLVAIQALLLVGIALAPASWGPSLPALRVWGGALFAVGGAGIAGAAWFLGRALTPVPEPNGAGMAARGVYAWVRHPMYTSVVVASVGVAIGRGAFVSVLLAVGLGFFFEFKTRREERFLTVAYSGYASYAARTGKFVPRLGKRFDPSVGRN